MGTAAEMALDYLILHGLVEVTINDDGENVYRLTDAGKEYADTRRRMGRK